MKKKLIIGLILLMIFGYVVSAANVTTVLSSISGNYSIIWAYNSSDTSDPWKKFVPGAATGNDLADMGTGVGYWISLNVSNATLTVTGTAPSSTGIPLADGWNLIGYPSSTAQVITTALSGISGNYTIVWAYNASDTGDPWKKFVPGAATGNDLASMVSGYGYWIRLNVSSATLTI